MRTQEFPLIVGLDRLVRRTLRESVGREEPSPEVWRGIVKSIEARGEKKHQRTRKGPLHLRSAALAQAVVLITLMVVFSFGLDRGFHVSQTARQPTPTASVIEDLSALGSGLDDMLSGLRLAGMAREMTVMDYRLAPFVDCPR